MSGRPSGSCPRRGPWWRRARFSLASRPRRCLHRRSSRSRQERWSSRLAGTLSNGIHGGHRDAGQVPARPGLPATRLPRRRPWGDLRLRAGPDHRGGREADVRRHNTAASRATGHARIANDSRARPACRLDARWRSVCVRRSKGTLFRAQLPRVPPHPAARPRRRGDGGEHRAAVPGPQRVRIRADLRSVRRRQRSRDGTCVRTPAEGICPGTVRPHTVVARGGRRPPMHRRARAHDRLRPSSATGA
jgi:hypothetical protein